MPACSLLPRPQYCRCFPPMWILPTSLYIQTLPGESAIGFLTERRSPDLQSQPVVPNLWVAPQPWTTAYAYQSLSLGGYSRVTVDIFWPWKGLRAPAQRVFIPSLQEILLYSCIAFQSTGRICVHGGDLQFSCGPLWIQCLLHKHWLSGCCATGAELAWVSRGRNTWFLSSWGVQCGWMFRLLYLLQPKSSLRKK